MYTRATILYSGAILKSTYINIYKSGYLPGFSLSRSKNSPELETSMREYGLDIEMHNSPRICIETSGCLLSDDNDGWLTCFKLRRRSRRLV